ncbi:MULTISPECIES: YbdD/YjiX family protein [Lysobacteraceae]|nr:MULTISPECIES: YbdD/YjiX family protein [Lysobacter]
MRFAEQWRDAWRAALQTARLAIGVPDYDAYVAHVRAHHPGDVPMTREAFCVERMHARYGRGRSRCC